MAFADLTDVRIYYEISGEGEPLVLIPGLASTCEIWNLIAPQLSKSFCTIRFDNRGIGRSLAKRKPRTVRDYSADLIELLDHLQVSCANLLGLSLGGIIAQRFAVDHPDRMGRLVLVSCTHSFTPYLREMAKHVGQSLRWFPKAAFSRTIEVLGCGPLYFDANPQRINERIRMMRQMNVSGRDVICQLRALGASKIDPEEYRILAQTLVIGGEFDSLIPHCYGRIMADLIPGSHFMVIPNAGHNPFNDCPEKVLPVVLRFLQTGRVPFGDDRDVISSLDRKLKEHPKRISATRSQQVA